MVSGSQTTSLKRYLPHVVLCTSAVAIIPIALVTFLESSGFVDSLVLSLVIGAAVSVTIATAGSKIWMAWFDATDVVFGDLLLWGWLRRLRNERRMQRSVDRLGLRHGASSSTTSGDRQSRIRALKDLARALETRDPYTHGHSRRVERHSYMIAKAMRLPERLAETIRVAASVHDVGKLDVPLAVLRKPGKLTDEEFELIKSHAARGAEMVAALGDPQITAMVRHHHERLDGKGYPDGLAGAGIPLGARIIGAADTFDAIVSSRAYRGAARHKRAIEIMRNEAGVQLDRDVVAAFLSYYSGRSSFEWWASVSTLPQRALRVFGIDGASSTAVAQGAAAVTAGVVLAGTSIVPWTIDSVRSEFASGGGIRAALEQELAAAGLGSDELAAAFGPPGANGGSGFGSGAGDSQRLVDEDDLTRSDLVAETERDADAESGSTRPVRGAVDDTTKTVDDTTKTVTDTVDDTTKTVTDTVDDTTKTVTDTVDDTTKKLDDTVNDTTKTVTDTVDDTSKKLDDTVNDTSKKLDDAVDDTTKTVTDTVDDITKKVLGSPHSY